MHPPTRVTLSFKNIIFGEKKSLGSANGNRTRISALKGPERNRVFIGFFGAFSHPWIHIALIVEGNVSYGGRRRQARYPAPVLRAANSRPTMQRTINWVDAGAAEDTAMKIRG
jgi:hypothetical protein